MESYYSVMRQRVLLGGQRIVRLHKAGLAGWDDVEPALTLLAEDVQIAAGTRVLVLESGGGALAVWAAGKGAEVVCYDSSVIGVRLTRAALDENGVSGQVMEAACPSASDAGTFDLALLPIPKGRAYARALIAGAARALKPGARLYLAGPNAGGAKAVVQDAGEIMGRSATLRTKARNRLAMAVRLAGTGALVAAPGENFHEFTWDDLALFGAPGVFSWEAVDDGTARLLATMDAALCEGQRVLDVGCGVGVIGLQAARLGAAAVDMVDAAWLAVDCARQGVQSNWLADRCRVWASDLYSDVPAIDPESNVPAGYDLILSNPPFHVGHAVGTDAAEALIRGAFARLNRGGRLRVVANLFLPYDRLMADVFGQGRVTTVAEDTRYRVLQAVR